MTAAAWVETEPGKQAGPCPECGLPAQAWARTVSSGLTGASCVSGCDPAAILAGLPKPKPSSPATKQPVREVQLVAAASIRPAAPRFLLDGRVPLGAFTILAGPPGQGKTTWAGHLAALVSRGQAPGDLFGKPASVLFASREDSPEHVLVPRLTAADADLARVHFVRVADKDGAGDLTLPDDTERLIAAGKQAGAGLILLDPISGYLAGSVNTWKDGDVRRVLGPIAEHADQAGIAVLGVMHLNRAEGRDALGRISGSGAFGAAARSVLLFGLHPDDPDDSPRRLVTHAKSSWAKLAPALLGGIVGATVGEIETSAWKPEGEAAFTAADLLDRDESSGRSEAEHFIRAELADGAVSAKDLLRRARDVGISESTLKRAKKRLAVVSEQDRGEGKIAGWTWRLPDDGKRTALIPPDPLDTLDLLDTQGGQEDQEAGIGTDGPVAPEDATLGPFDPFAPDEVCTS